MKNIFIIITMLSGLICSCSSNKENKASAQPEETKPDTLSTGSETDHTVITLQKQDFAFAVRTGGRIMADSKGVEVVTAKTSGIVKFNDRFLFTGVKVTKGQKLFTISGEQLAEGNTDLKLWQLKADLEKASANYERAKSLIADRLITQSQFLDVKNEYEKIRREFDTLNSNFGSSGYSVSSSANGYIRDVFVTEGQMVSAGQQLASVVTEFSMVLKADLPPEYMNMLPAIEKANFIVGYNKKVFKTDEMNGRRISFGKSIGENSFYIPVYFRMDYSQELIDGTFAEVYLIGKEMNNVLVVPNSALMEEYGKIYVFVEDEDGDFIKRYISTGHNNGEFTEVLEGLAENESIVATGTYNIKLSQMSGGAPAHAHNH